MSKRSKPKRSASIRMDEDARRIIDGAVTLTGWPITRVVSFLIKVGRICLVNGPIDTRDMKALFDSATALHTAEKSADLKLASKRAAVRKAAAKVKATGREIPAAPQPEKAAA